ncbi:hypothetical protein H6G17_32235 [Chroococcidiopsis sp. FACHB-1243]|nr:hypothetical protein [Chroococcidiopsis sp. [FACHB-1243]]
MLTDSLFTEKYQKLYEDLSQDSTFLIQTINTQIEKLKELRKTLINDVVTGKIKVIE